MAPRCDLRRRRIPGGPIGSARRTRAVALLVAALVPLGVMACGSDAAAPTSLPDGTYALVTIDGRDLVEGSTIELLVEGDTINLGAGCNRMFGGYAIDDGTLVVDQLASTKMACEPASMAQDEWLSAMITAGPQIDIAGDRLAITDDVVTLEFALPVG